jgi:hypothetical protein
MPILMKTKELIVFGEATKYDNISLPNNMVKKIIIILI